MRLFRFLAVFLFHVHAHNSADAGLGNVLVNFLAAFGAAGDFGLSDFAGVI